PLHAIEPLEMQVAGLEADEERALAILLAERGEDRGRGREELPDDAEAIRGRAEHLLDTVRGISHRMQRAPELEQERGGVIGGWRVAGAAVGRVGHERTRDSSRQRGGVIPCCRMPSPGTSNQPTGCQAMLSVSWEERRTSEGTRNSPGRICCW